MFCLTAHLTAYRSFVSDGLAMYGIFCVLFCDSTVLRRECFVRVSFENNLVSPR